MLSRQTAILIPASVAILLAAVGCSSATYDDRTEYLRKVAQQGANTHQLWVAQDGPTINADRCGQAWDELQRRPGEFPSDTMAGSHSKPWVDQLRQFFIDSCVSGEPKPVPGDTQPPAPSSTPTTS